jgi:hypothetical protein
LNVHREDRTLLEKPQPVGNLNYIARLGDIATLSTRNKPINQEEMVAS